MFFYKDASLKEAIFIHPENIYMYKATSEGSQKA